MCSMNSFLSPVYLEVAGPARCLEASTRSSLREERQRANTDSPGEREREREREGGREREREREGGREGEGGRERERASEHHGSTYNYYFERHIPSCVHINFIVGILHTIIIFVHIISNSEKIKHNDIIIVRTN